MMLDIGDMDPAVEMRRFVEDSARRVAFLESVIDFESELPGVAAHFERVLVGERERLARWTALCAEAGVEL